MNVEQHSRDVAHLSLGPIEGSFELGVTVVPCRAFKTAQTLDQLSQFAAQRLLSLGWPSASKLDAQKDGLCGEKVLLFQF